MSKITAGYCVVGGLLCGGFCIMAARTFSQMEGNPNSDLIQDLATYGFGGLAILSLGVFAYGASKFTNAK
ncbi:hypothetical protein VN12_19495 [Pirellula sp. SH-Sr6A]|uniref:hypothetical protein n=1 Tax=Pirellula sp. SH-Sr6A TaxID=1632865 RepID=UPI00078DC330|nr:hypothetical protein [Pirellula sp. SH-Sr6A]AMV34319.1 hypothetical protein VN12_19495 [Pirellula sp. SH-Sr6A]